MRVVLRNVCKDIKGARVLDNVNLELESGMVYGFKGKNGSGKTMLMRAISGLIKVNGTHSNDRPWKIIWGAPSIFQCVL